MRRRLVEPLLGSAAFEQFRATSTRSSSCSGWRAVWTWSKKAPPPKRRRTWRGNVGQRECGVALTWPTSWFETIVACGPRSACFADAEGVRSGVHIVQLPPAAHTDGERVSDAWSSCSSTMRPASSAFASRGRRGSSSRSHRGAPVRGPIAVQWIDNGADAASGGPNRLPRVVGCDCSLAVDAVPPCVFGLCRHNAYAPTHFDARVPASPAPQVPTGWCRSRAAMAAAPSHCRRWRVG